MKIADLREGEEYLVHVPTLVKVLEKGLPRRVTTGGRVREIKDLVKVQDRAGRIFMARSHLLAPTLYPEEYAEEPKT